MKSDDGAMRVRDLQYLLIYSMMLMKKILNQCKFFVLNSTIKHKIPTKTSIHKPPI
mgnify:CR=1 FL=1